ncbi:MAG: DUF922 domain-containing protein, partial [Candidatus Rokubacteria bacterium]|nr:DUF922 domain-containing protein [Candidatus Rokubacteria bacterium]
EYYQVTGASERELRAQLKALGPERHHALTKWTLSWSYPFAIEGGRCATGPITVDVKMTLVFPRWTAPASAPPTLRQKWSAALAGLQRHEDGHREIVLRAAHDVLQTLGSLPPYTSCNELKQAASTAGHRILDRSRREHDAYDELTKRGTTQGAHW